MAAGCTPLLDACSAGGSLAYLRARIMQYGSGLEERASERAKVCDESCMPPQS